MAKEKPTPIARKNTSVRRKKLLQKLVENGGKSVSKAMIEVGYSPATAHSPQKVTKSKAWNDLVEHYLPDTLLTSKLGELLRKKDVITTKYLSTSKKGKVTYKVKHIYQPHSDVKGALDMAFKIKGKYAPQEIKFTNKLTKETLDRLRIEH